jgi:hypothetical protein
MQEHRLARLFRVRVARCITWTNETEIKAACGPACIARSRAQEGHRIDMVESVQGRNVSGMGPTRKSLISLGCYDDSVLELVWEKSLRGQRALRVVLPCLHLSFTTENDAGHRSGEGSGHKKYKLRLYLRLILGVHSPPKEKRESRENFKVVQGGGLTGLCWRGYPANDSQQAVGDIGGLDRKWKLIVPNAKRQLFFLRFPFVRWN